MAFRPTTLLAPLALAALLGGCAAPGTGGSAAAAPGDSGAASAPDSGAAYTPMSSGAASSAFNCDTDSVQAMLGRAYSDSVGEAARKDSGSRVVRLLKPGQVMTMEYDPTRINIILDDKGAIQALRCG